MSQLSNIKFCVNCDCFYLLLKFVQENKTAIWFLFCQLQIYSYNQKYARWWFSNFLISISLTYLLIFVQEHKIVYIIIYICLSHIRVIRCMYYVLHVRSEHICLHLSAQIYKYLHLPGDAINVVTSHDVINVVVYHVNEPVHAVFSNPTNFIHFHKFAENYL